MRIFSKKIPPSRRESLNIQTKPPHTGLKQSVSWRNNQQSNWNNKNNLFLNIPHADYQQHENDNNYYSDQYKRSADKDRHILNAPIPQTPKVLDKKISYTAILAILAGTFLLTLSDDSVNAEENDKSKDVDDKTRKEDEIYQALIKACREGSYYLIVTLLNSEGEIVRTLLKKSHILNEVVKGKGDLKTFKLLVENGANVHLLDDWKWTVFHWSAYNNHAEILEYLWENYPSEITRLSGKGWFNGSETLLHLAARGKAPRTLQFILKKKKFDIEVRDQNGNTPLIWAVEAGCLPCCEMLLQHNANILTTNMRGETPLHVAAKKRSDDILIFILKATKDVNIRDKEGLTPLHVAVRNHQESAVKILVDAGADLFAKDVKGLGPFDISQADSDRHKEFVNNIRIQLSSIICERYLKVNNFESAREYAELAVTANPNNVRMHQILAEIYYKRQEYDTALKHYNQIKRLDKNNANLAFDIANTYLEMGDYVNAIENFEEALKLNNKMYRAYFYKGMAFLELGQAEKAIADFEQYLNNPTLNDYERSTALALLGKGQRMVNKTNEANKNINAAVRLAPDNNVASQELTDLKLTETVQTPRYSYTEYNIPLEYLLDDAMNGNPKPLEIFFQSRRAFSHDEFDKIADSCIDQIVFDFHNRDKNPQIINEAVGTILNFSAIEGEKEKWPGEYIAYLWGQYKHPFEQHLKDGRDIRIPGNALEKIREDSNYIKVPREYVQKGEGFQPLYFLALRIRSLFSLYVRVRKNIIPVTDLLPNNQMIHGDEKIRKNEENKIRNELSNKLKDEIVCMIEIFRSHRDAFLINKLSRKNIAVGTLIDAHINNLMQKINQLKSGQEYPYLTGHSEHAIFVNIFKRNTGRFKNRIDNLGDGIKENETMTPTEIKGKFRHRFIKKGDHFYFYPCLIEVDNIEKYLRDIHEAQFVEAYFVPDWKLNPKYKWSWIYKTPCMDTTTDYPHWTPSLQQKVGNCLAASHNIGFEIRFGRYFEWVRQKEVDMASRDNPDYFKEMKDKMQTETPKEYQPTANQFGIYR